MNWGILGTAEIAKKAVLPALKRLNQHDFLAVSSRDNNTGNLFAKSHGIAAINGYQNLLNQKNIDAVYIPLPIGLHFEWVINALHAGKHVLVEKTAFETLEQTQMAVELARMKNLALVENFQFQHHSQHQFVKDLLQSSDVGEVRSFRASFGFPPFDEGYNIRYDKRIGGGSLFDAGAYTLKVTNFMMGGGFEVEAASLAYHPEYDVDWFGNGYLFNSKNGISSQVSFGFDNFYQCNYEIWCSKAKLTVTRAYTAKRDFRPAMVIENAQGVRNVSLDPDDHFLNMLVHFNSLVGEENYESEYLNILEQAKLIDGFRTKALS